MPDLTYIIRRFRNTPTRELAMRADIHPEYREVLFHDTAADAYFVISSTVSTDRTHDYEGKTYPYVTVDVSSASHPFYTGKQKVSQSDGRIAKFNSRFSRRTTK